jgi:hypothetical protein
MHGAKAPLALARAQRALESNQRRRQASPKQVLKTGKYFGRTTGMRIAHYQDHTLMIDDENRHFTDAELVKAWHDEHPDARHLNNQDVNGVFTSVRSIRGAYNRGKGGHGVRDRAGNIVGPPKAPSLPYKKNRIWGVRQTYVYERQWLSSYY